MAFVSATPLLPSSRTSLPARALTSSPPASNFASRRPCMALEFQTYSGGLDRVSTDPYSITRYLFKPSPATLTEQEKDVVVTAGLRQVFGNAYLMEEERAELYMAESKFRCGEITAKEFVRACAKSDTYRKRFFESVSQYRFIELNFKHLLGRAPLNQVEYSKHFKIFANGGYEAEIDSYFDEEEYDDVFGEDVMPFTRFRGTYAPISQFNRMCSLEGGFAGSDKKKPLTLVSSLADNKPIPAFSVADGLPAIPNAEHPTKKYALPDASLERFRNELEVAKAKAYELQVQLNQEYDKLNRCRKDFNPFQAMVADMDIIPVYGRNYGNGAVTVFSGQYQGAPTDSWGPSGVANINGPTRRPAAAIGIKEKQLERTKQLCVDLERRVAVLEAERERPAITPPSYVFQLSGVVEVETQEVAAPAVQVAPAEPEPEVTELPIDEQAVENLIVTTAPAGAPEVASDKVNVVTSRQLADVGKLPKELIEEAEAEKKAAGKEFGAGISGKPSFPGDGSEMVIGG